MEDRYYKIVEIIDGKLSNYSEGLDEEILLDNNKMKSLLKLFEKCRIIRGFNNDKEREK